MDSVLLGEKLVLPRGGIAHLNRKSSSRHAPRAAHLIRLVVGIQLRVEG